MEDIKGRTPGGIHYQTLRGGTEPKETLLMIMGYSGSIVSWTSEFLHELLPSFDLVLLDNRGTGYSFHPESIDDITVPAMAGDVREVVQHLGLKHFNLLGYSLGGCIAQQYTALYPETVKHLVLLSTTGGGKLYVPPGATFLADLQNPTGSSPFEMALSMWRLCISDAAMDEHRERLKLLHDKQMEKATPRRTFAGQMKAFRGFATEQAFQDQSARPPITIISGRNDRLMPHGNSLKLREYFVGSRLIEIEDCEHMPYLEKKAQLLQALRTSLLP
ncbi:MAG TPA: alpha/beta hydrolase [Oligoflexus sp.]|uniref:alpha/beta fold hydrolase n=1 Tax=Oligoflexus sp. TaxID=1971216 RepID=UPI002D74C372|nr:alpha/beta hydrolase [Oligoflexus sp.]HYX32896.1 alpha/beta hydrolase [Oligoflexus sp.]